MSRLKDVFERTGYYNENDDHKYRRITFDQFEAAVRDYNKWIRIEDDLPKKGIDVVTINMDSGISGMYFPRVQRIYANEKTFGLKATHWAYLFPYPDKPETT